MATVDISIVLPCMNEVRHGYLTRVLDNFANQPGKNEVAIVVSEGCDQTCQLVSQHPNFDMFQIISSKAINRAQRLNEGIEATCGEIVLLSHPATLLPSNATAQVREIMADELITWGGFRHSFDTEHWLLKFTSWYSTIVRPQISGTLYLDHCIFARRKALETIGGVPYLDIFEDTTLSAALRKYGRPQLAAGTAVTSARRFLRRGIYKHAILNQFLKLMYHTGAGAKLINKIYEKKDQINVRFDRTS